MSYYDISYDRHPDDTLGFGKHKNLTWRQVQAEAPDYLIWLSKSDFGRSDQTITDVINSLYEVNLDLAEDQQFASDTIVNQLLVDDGTVRCFRLQGAAGYGKSYCVTDIATRAKRLGFDNITGIAASYVATQVLAESLDPIGVESKTIAQALALRPDKDSYNETYGPSGDTPYQSRHLVGGNALLVVDEYSMTDDETVDIIYKAMNDEDNQSRLLVVGDSYQLPSPKQNFMNRFDAILPMVELTTPKRFDVDSPLHRIERLTRDNPWQLNTHLNLLAGEEWEHTIPVAAHRNKQALVKRQIEDLEGYPEDTSLMLFYRRAQVAEANRYIRGTVYGPDSPQIGENERLRVMRTTFMPTIFDEEKGNWEYVKFYSGTFLTAKDVEVATTVVTFDSPDLPANDLPRVSVESFVLRPLGNIRTAVIFSKAEHSADPEMQGGKSFNTMLQQVRAYCIDHADPYSPQHIKGVWKLYHHFRNHFLQISYAYATTVHRSQGASVDRIYMCPKDVLQGGDYIARRLAYVAATRARKQIHYTG